MLKSLSISNFAIIDSLEINFDSGLSIITGETGAGKSIFIGALSLVLGSRAEIAQIKDKGRKCVIEAIFDIKEYDLSPFFRNNDLDYEDYSIIRREILSSGKSRAFINDSPVNLNILKELSNKLVDIHSQHQSLIIGNSQFQILVIDEVAGLNESLIDYRKKYYHFINEKSVLNSLISESQTRKKDHDYFVFQYNQLLDANLSDINELANVESELKELSHAEDIKHSLNIISGILSSNDESALNIFKSTLSELSKIKSYFGKGEEFYNRIDSVEIEVSDIAGEIDKLSYEIEYDPEKISQLTNRIDLLNSLFQKNQVSGIEELISLRDSLANSINEIDSYDSRINEQTNIVSELGELINKLALGISEKRKSVIPEIEERIINMLQKLGMPGARFHINRNVSGQISENGIDDFLFLFSASKKGELLEIGKAASGGELSRLMLCIKSLIVKSANLPTIIFDEIDTGVSGEIADKVGDIIKSMANDMQVINITHLPQVAAKGDRHFRIYKVDSDNGVSTFIELLDKESRVKEIAKMLSGADISEAAIQNARILLKQ